MRKLLLSVICTVLCVTFGFSQKGTIPLKSDANAVTLTENSYEKLSVTFKHSEIRSFSVETKAGLFDEIVIPGARFTGKIGEPKLPAYVKLIEVPFGAKIKATVSNYSEAEYTLPEYGIHNPIMPAQPDVSKSLTPENAEFHFNQDAYEAKSFTNFNMVDVEILGVMRGVQIAKLSVSPVNYNPSTQVIKVYNNIEVDVTFDGADVGKTVELKKDKFSPYFETVYKSVINYKGVYEDHPDLTKYPVKMLVLADRQFEEALVPFIEWKTKKGFEVILNYTDEGYGSVAEIKAWIQGHYDAGTETDPAPSFCLFVGDVDQIPASQTGVNSGKLTDLYYFSQDGDYFPEMYYGRFSANNLTELQPIIDKTLYYERYEFADPTYLDDATLIAGADGTWNPNVGQPTVQYGTEYYFNTANGYTNVNAYLDSYDGCYDPERIAVSFINYTAHCNEGVWGTPQLTISDINAMVNDGKYPLAVGNCCLSANFGYSSECIGEAWIRAENKGAVAYIGSSPSTYWFEDFYWAVGAFPIEGNNDGYVPTPEETTMGVYDGMFAGDYKTVDALVFLGNLAVTEVDVQGYQQHSNPLYYWEAYNCLGDPSLVTYNTQGEQNVVSHLPTLPIGVSTYEVSAEPGSYVAISKEGVLHGAALVGETGSVEVPIDPVTSGGDVDIVVTRPQYQPYMTTVPAAALEGPYMVVKEFNNSVDYGQGIELALTLENVGADAATGVEVSIASTDDNATITNPTYSFGDVASGAITDPSSGALNVSVANDLDDQYMVPIDFTITDAADNTWEQTKYVIVNAPVLHVGAVSVDDTEYGNGDGILDPGETADLLVSVTNEGHAGLDDVNAVYTVVGGSEYITFTNTEAALGSIAAEATAEAVFEVTADAETPLGTPVELTFDVAGGVADQYAGTADHMVIIGFVPEYCASGASYDADSEIDEVAYGNMVNNTAGVCGTYNDYTENPDLVEELMVGANLDISITLGTCGGDYSKAAKVFVDWNYDGDFDDENEMIFETGVAEATETFTATVTVPADAPLGQKYLRVVCSENESSISPCGEYSYGETEDYKIILVAPEPPVADFEANPTETTQGDVVEFTDLTTNAPIEWTWTITPGTEGTDFVYVNETSANSQNPMVQFQTPDVYTVALTSANIVGSDTETKTDYITISPVTAAPEANFEVDVTVVNPGEAVHFTDLSTNTPTSWTWTITPGSEGTEYSFVEGTNANSQNPAVAFSTPGFYSVQLVAGNVVGDSDPYVATDLIEVLTVFVMTDGATATTCSGTFYDMGGPDGEYESNASLSMTFYPGEDGKMLNFNFTMFSVEDMSSGGCYDELRAYDGVDVSAPLIGTYCDNNPATVITATNEAGAITFVFESDGSVTQDGWEAEISCVVGPEYYTVTFNVTDGTNAIEGASVSINGETLTTDAAGMAAIELVDGSYDYTVSNSGYSNATGTIAVSGADVSEDVILTPEATTYMVTFDVTADGSPAEGAQISCDGHDMTTNAEGQASLEMEPGDYSYTVTMEGYGEESGTFTVSDQDITVNVAMVGMNDISSVGLNLYPNPNDGTFTIQVNGNYDIYVMNAIGKVIHTQNINKEGQINLQDVSEGIYFIRLTNGHKSVTQRFIINK